MKNIIKTLVLRLFGFALTSLALAGCTAYGEKFDCAPGMGVGCKSLSYVDRMVEKGNLPKDEEDVPDLKASLKKSADTVNENSHKSGDLKMWVAGYEDEQGHYHEPSYITIKDE